MRFRERGSGSESAVGSVDHLTRTPPHTSTPLPTPPHPRPAVERRNSEDTDQDAKRAGDEKDGRKQRVSVCCGSGGGVAGRSVRRIKYDLFIYVSILAFF